MGSLVYEPPRDGPTLWEIGIPDRSAAEFHVPEPNPRYLNHLFVNNPKRFGFLLTNLLDSHSNLIKNVCNRWVPQNKVLGSTLELCCHNGENTVLRSGPIFEITVILVVYRWYSGPQITVHLIFRRIIYIYIYSSLFLVNISFTLIKNIVSTSKH